MGRPLPAGLLSCGDKEEEEIIILGMPGPWAEHNSEASDPYTTKIGGLPDWPIPPEEINLELMKCGVCGEELGLVAQVYAPIETDRLNIQERTLYIFGCPIPNCGLSPLSWRTMRIQKRIPIAEPSQSGLISGNSILEASTSTSSNITGRLGWEEEESSSSTNEWWDDDAWRHARNGEDIDEAFDMHELSTALLEAGYMAAHAPVGDQNGGSHALVEEATRNQADLPNISLPVLPCFYVFLQNESHPSRGSTADSALDYSVDYQVRQNNAPEEAGEETWEKEEYEHASALHVDRTYLKFKKRLDYYPGQCFRYCFGGRPLLANKDQGDPGVCEVCGGPRVYEMQLMPPLLFYLQQACKDSLSMYSANNWEWLTLLVYTCAQSCSGASEDGNGEKEWIVVEEATIIQYET